MTNYKNEEFNIIYTDKNLTKEITNLNTKIKDNDKIKINKTIYTKFKNLINKIFIIYHFISRLS